jgi:hypothetical protein
MTFKKVAENIYSCIDCHDKCDGKSNLLYNFKDNVEFSEHRASTPFKKTKPKDITL